MSSQASVFQQANKKHASSLMRKNIRKFVNNRLAMIGLVVVVVIECAVELPLVAYLELGHPFDQEASYLIYL